MWSKNKKPMTAAERRHVDLVKSLPCSVCDKAGPSDAHELEQGNWWTAVALCRDCHTGKNGIHGQKTMWRVMKMNELDALGITIARAYGGVR